MYTFVKVMWCQIIISWLSKLLIKRIEQHISVVVTISLFHENFLIYSDFRCATTSSDSPTGSKDDHSPPSMREDCQIDEKEASSTSFLNGCHVTKDNDTTCSGNVISINQQSQRGLVQGIYWVYALTQK